LEPYLLANTATAFGTLRGMTAWLSGITGNLDQTDAAGHFAWVGPSGHSPFTHFTWKHQLVPVEWVRQIPQAAINHLGEKMADFYHWVKVGWEPTELIERIRSGFGSHWELEPDQLFVEGPNDSESFLTMPRSGLLQYAGLIKQELAAQSRLVVEVDDHVELMQLTKEQFFDHASKIIQVCLLFVLFNRLTSV
jgi:hypothetical protein